jgi:hypothetical protein
MRYFALNAHCPHVLIDDLIPHGVHNKTRDRLGANFRFHILADGFDGPCT